ncbi:IS5 family transposase [Streptomyces daghestanicus]|uniref:IS5 family transposase n=1 Tax=Streptomyces daghestanicus TaxID=66885 RepID=A0ABQ3QE46_9ACTN|nr:IS5 family transposase [Streptomyces daghestanicus]GHI35578.1 IS5 family transposase [Streptomyces daghestanicus]
MGDPPAGRTDDHAPGHSQGGLATKVHLACDGKGRPLAVLWPSSSRLASATTVSADASCSNASAFPAAVPGRPRCRPGPDQVIADKAHSSCGFRAYLRRRGIAHTIPEKADQRRHRLRRASRGGRPPGFDRDIYRRRNLVERCFNRLKDFRRIATRYDKTATSHEAAVTLASLLLWARSV